MTVMSFKTRTGCSLWTFQVFSQQQGAAQGRDDRFVIADLYAVHLALVHWSWSKCPRAA